MVLIKEEWNRVIKIEKQDEKQQYIWIKIKENATLINIETCYFTPRNSKFYKKHDLNKEGPYSSLQRDILMYNKLGEIIVVVYFNARKTNKQATILKNTKEIDINPIWMLEEENKQWIRNSEDEHGGITQCVEELLGLCSTHNLIIYNVMN